MHVGRDEDDLEGPSQWNIAQFALACVGTMSVTTFTKYPMYQYYGSGWGVLCFVLYLLTGAGAILYIQMRVSCEHRRSQISLFSKYLPFTKAIAIAFMMRNLIQVVQVGALMAHMLSYIMFGLYRCNGQICVGSLYMWSTCYDTWNTPQCNNAELQVRIGPTPEDQFFQNYALDHVISWDSSSPSAYATSQENTAATLGGFPTWLNIYALEQTLLVAAWLAISLCVAFGPRIFGLILYGLAPAALVAFFIVFFYTFAALAQYPYINTVFSKLYGQMMTIMSLLTTQVDPFYYQPFVVFFIIAPRIFGMWGVHPSIMVIWFSAIFLLALISNSLLILTTVDNIVDDLRRYSRKVDRAPEKARRWVTGIICITLYLLCEILVTRAGIFFIVTIDYYIDLLLFVLIPFAGAAYFVVYVRTQNVGGEKVRKTEKIIVSVLYFFGLIVSLAAFIDLMVYFVKNNSTPSYDGVNFPQPLVIIGWLIAASPILIGFLVGIPLAVREGSGSCAERCTRLAGQPIEDDYQTEGQDTAPVGKKQDFGTQETVA